MTYVLHCNNLKTPLCHIYSSSQCYVLQIKDIEDLWVRVGMPCLEIFC